MTHNNIEGFLLTEDETKACLELIKKMREEEEHKRINARFKNAIWFEASNAISKIGLEETKRIVRELNRELRDFKSGGNA